MAIFASIKSDRIVRSKSARSLNIEVIEQLKSSVERLGLLNPITVRKNGDGYELIAGGHRLEAVRQLGLAEIECIVIEAVGLEAELATIDENLCRAELTPVQFSKQLVRRKAIYEELHPETRHGAIGGGHDQSCQLGDSGMVERFTANTAAATRTSERSIQRGSERGEKLSEEAAELIEGTHLDTGAFLDEIKDLPPEEQLERAKAELGLDNSQSEGTAAKRRASRAKQPADKIQTFMKLADRMERLNVAEFVLTSADRRQVVVERVSRLIAHLNGILEEPRGIHQEHPVSSVSAND